TNTFIQKKSFVNTLVNNNTKELLVSYLKGSTPEKATDELITDFSNSKHIKFYKIVGDLFSIIFGVKSYPLPSGVNNARYDVIIEDSENSVPVEVKSPTEELAISIKAIRQALENKIIMLSREHYKTTFEMTTLAVAFEIPNNRSDVTRLIHDIHVTFNINIAIVDFKTLCLAAMNVLETGKNFDLDGLMQYRGVLKFGNL